MQTSCGKLIILNPADEEYFSRWSWCLTAGYPSRRVTYDKGVSCIEYLHHLIIGYPPTGKQVDHINRNKLDNRRENLRFVTPQQNLLNRAVKAKGVCFDNTHKKWKAYYDKITLGQPKKRINIGTFKTREEAVAARVQFLTGDH